MPKISELTEATSVDAADSLVIVQGGVTKKVDAGLLGVGVLANASTGTLNDVATTDSGTAVGVVRCAGAAPTINGLASGSSGRRLLVMATGGEVTLANEAGASVAANRIVTGTGASVTVANGSAALVVYDATSLRWRLVGSRKIAPAVSVSTLVINWSAGQVFTKTLAAGAQTFTFANAASGMVISVRLTSHASGSTVTWPTVKWAGGTPPTQSTPSKSDVYTFIHDGTSIYGSVVQDLS